MTGELGQLYYASLDRQRDCVNDVDGVDLLSRFLYVPFDGAG